MCEPTSIAMGIASLVIGAASAISQGQQARAQARAQNAYQEAQAAQYAKAAEMNNKATIQEYVEQSAAERISQMQEQKAAADSSAEQQAVRLKNQGTMIASSNAAGVAMDLLMGDYMRQEANNKQKIRTQYLNTAVGSDAFINSFKQKAQNKINSQQDYIYMESDNSAATTMGTLLGIGSAAVNAYGVYSNAQAKMGTEPAGIKSATANGITQSVGGGVGGNTLTGVKNSISSRGIVPMIK